MLKVEDKLKVGLDPRITLIALKKIIYRNYFFPGFLWYFFLSNRLKKRKNPDKNIVRGSDMTEQQTSAGFTPQLWCEALG